jgi:hypothetical protein
MNSLTSVYHFSLCAFFLTNLKFVMFWISVEALFLLAPNHSFNFAFMFFILFYWRLYACGYLSSSVINVTWILLVVNVCLLATRWKGCGPQSSATNIPGCHNTVHSKFVNFFIILFVSRIKCCRMSPKFVCSTLNLAQPCLCNFSIGNYWQAFQSLISAYL